MSQVFDRPEQVAEEAALELTVQAVGTCTEIALGGRLCAGGEELLWHCLDAVLDAGCRLVVLDLDHVGAVDDGGLQVLVRAARRLRRRGAALELRAAEPWPFLLPDRAGLVDLLGDPG